MGHLAQGGAEKLEDGRFYLDAEKIKELPDSDFKNPQERKDLGDKIRTLFYDIAATATSKPSDARKAKQRGGLRSGTFAGEAASFALQFKSILLNITETHMGRFLWGYHPDKVSLADAIKRLYLGHEGTWEMGRFLATSTLMGYLGMTMKDLAKGKEPQIPDSPEATARVMLQAMAEGGGAGIWGDYLFMQAEARFGAGPLESLLGPTWSKVSTGYDLLSGVATGDPSAARALNFLISNTPGQNLFYARTALDYLFLYRLQEMVNPGVLKRRERRLKKEKGQEYFIPPSEVVR